MVLFIFACDPSMRGAVLAGVPPPKPAEGSCSLVKTSQQPAYRIILPPQMHHRSVTNNAPEPASCFRMGSYDCTCLPQNTRIGPCYAIGVFVACATELSLTRVLYEMHTREELPRIVHNDQPMRDQLGGK